MIAVESAAEGGKSARSLASSHGKRDVEFPRRQRALSPMQYAASHERLMAGIQRDQLIRERLMVAESSPPDAHLPAVCLALEAAEQVACWLRDGVTARDALEAMGRPPGGGWPQVFAAVMREISKMGMKENA